MSPVPDAIATRSRPLTIRRCERRSVVTLSDLTHGPINAPARTEQLHGVARLYANHRSMSGGRAFLVLIAAEDAREGYALAFGQRAEGFRIRQQDSTQHL